MGLSNEINKVTTLPHEFSPLKAKLSACTRCCYPEPHIIHQKGDAGKAPYEPTDEQPRVYDSH